jgi:hypothetical protein
MKTHAVVALAFFTLSAAELPKAPPLLQPDERYKADILLVVAHPDDDVVIGGYLARASLDERGGSQSSTAPTETAAAMPLAMKQAPLWDSCGS